jgi:hypothetical protein
VKRLWKLVSLLRASALLFSVRLWIGLPTAAHAQYPYADDADAILTGKSVASKLHGGTRLYVRITQPCQSRRSCDAFNI